MRYGYENKIIWNLIMNNTSMQAFFAPLVFAGSVLLSSAACAAASDVAALGSSTTLASRMITIDRLTDHVNVTAGDTVNFVVGERNFLWNFDVASNVYMFDLNKIAPQNMLTRRINVYVAPNLISIF